MNYFVSGGSRGIGAAIVLGAVADGHNVAFTYLRNKDAADDVVARAKALATDAGHDLRVEAFQMDVADSASVERTGDAVLESFETIEVLVNSAGINEDGLMVSMTDEQWNRVLATNLTGPFFTARYFLPSMLGSRMGRIINISSVQCHGGAGQANYAASKAGLNGLTFSIAKEYGRKGITANVIAPGFFDTDMTQKSLPEKAREYWKKHCPAPKGRLGRLEEIAATVRFLASKDAAYINGEVIHVTGGLNWIP